MSGVPVNRVILGSDSPSETNTYVCTHIFERSPPVLNVTRRPRYKRLSAILLMATGSVPAELVGQRVELVAWDPWDFVSVDGSVRFGAIMILAASSARGAEEERLLLQLSEPVSWRDKTIEFFVARQRHGHGMTDDLWLLQPIECNMIAVKAEQARGSDPFSTKAWRVRLAVNATLRLGQE